MAVPLLAIRDLHVAFRTAAGSSPALRGIDLDVMPGRTLGIVGESGSGKSVTALAILGLLPGAGVVTAGRVMLGGEDLLRCSERRMRAIRGGRIGLVFQDPSSSLNPIFTIGHQLREALVLHGPLGRGAAMRRAEELLELVRIPDPRGTLGRYPHELSGGMKQRVMIAIAISCGPALLIADEPTTALDVTTQAQILGLLHDLQDSLGMAIVLITHDLGIVAEYADDVAVMYAGRVVERASSAGLFARQAHPYTAGLLRSMPSLEEDDPLELPAIPGMAATGAQLPAGCAFHPRCGEAWGACREGVPALLAVAPGHEAACLLNAGP